MSGFGFHCILLNIVWLLIVYGTAIAGVTIRYAPPLSCLVDRVEIVGSFTGWQMDDMELRGGCFEYDLTNDNPAEFNINYFFSNQNWWAISAKDCSGILGKVDVVFESGDKPSITLDAGYLVDNGNPGGANLFFAPNSALGTISCYPGDSRKVTLPANVPEGSPHSKHTVINEIPPVGWDYIKGWAQAATLLMSQPISKEAKITVDYWRMIEIDNSGNETVIFEDDYETDSSGFDTNEGGLYDRACKWFETDNHSVITGMVIENGFLKIDVAQNPLNIIHWWMQREGGIPCNRDKKYLVEICMKIDGSLGFQMGADYYTASNNPNYLVEGWMSDWYGDTNGKFIIVRSGVIGDEASTFVRSCYVNPSGSCAGKNPCYQSVQDAIDSEIEGTIIKISSGHYCENISVNKNVKLEFTWDENFSFMGSEAAVIGCQDH